MDSALQAFVKLTSVLDYPMIVVTARDHAGPAGCLVGFSTQCSVDPARYLVCLSDKNRTERIASHADLLAVHFLASDALELARMFGEQTTDNTNTFARCRWHAGPSGVPILDDCGRWFVGNILQRQTLGDHVGFILEPIEACADDPQTQLSFQQVKDLDPGHEP